MLLLEQFEDSKVDAERQDHSLASSICDECNKLSNILDSVQASTDISRKPYFPKRFEYSFLWPILQLKLSELLMFWTEFLFFFWFSFNFKNYFSSRLRLYRVVFWKLLHSIALDFVKLDFLMENLINQVCSSISIFYWPYFTIPLVQPLSTGVRANSCRGSASSNCQFKKNGTGLAHSLQRKFLNYLKILLRNRFQISSSSWRPKKFYSNIVISRTRLADV